MHSRSLTTIDVEKPGPGYYSQEAGAWVLSKYDDVLAGLKSSGLRPAIPLLSLSSGEVTGSNDDGMQQHKHLMIAFEDLAANMGSLHLILCGLDSSIATDSVDVVSSVIHPNIRRLLEGAFPALDNESLISAVGIYFRSSAFPFDRCYYEDAQAAYGLLRQKLSPYGEISLQAYIALATSVPALIANSWHLLLGSRLQQEILLRDETKIPLFVDECMRLASPAKMLFRLTAALGDYPFGRCKAGELVILVSSAANRDPSVYESPNEVRLGRRERSSLSFGVGVHACVASKLVRSITVEFCALLLKIIKGGWSEACASSDGEAMQYITSLVISKKFQ